MREVFIERKCIFSSSHRLHSNHFSSNENDKLYGKCNNPNGHGHNYTLTLTLKGKMNPQTGMLINLTTVKKILKEQIQSRFDHKNLDIDTPYFEHTPSTAENIACVVWDILASTEIGPYLFCVRIDETQNNSALYYGG